MIRHIYSVTGRGGSWAQGLGPDSMEVELLDIGNSQELSHLMFNAYAGTIDDDGLSPAGAHADVCGFFAGEWGAPIPHSCVGHRRDGQLIAACLICDWNDDTAEVAGPLIAFLLVSPPFKGHGIGRSIANAALHRLALEKRGRVHAVITQGNTPSEKALCALGFRRHDRQ